jgi:hypothetical protein
LLGEGLGDALYLLARNARDALDFFRRPLGDFGADLVHAVDALRDELLVLPTIVEDVVQHAPDHRDVGAAAEANIFGGMRGRAGEARVEDEHVGAVDLLAGQDVLQRHRVRFGGIRSHEDDGLRVSDIIVGIRHRAVAPGIGDAGDGGRMADAGLVVHGIGAPERPEFAEQISAFIGEFRRSEQIDRVGAGLGADLEHLVADLVDGLVPGDALPLAVDQLHRIFQAPVAMDQLAHRRTDDFRPGLRLAHRSERHQAQCGARTRGETGAAQKGAAVEDSGRKAGGDILQTRSACRSISSLHQHVRGPINSG